MATLPTNVVPDTGLNAASIYLPASAGGDKAAPGAGVLLHVKNGDSSSHTVTLVTPGTVDGLAVADRTVTVAASGNQFIPVSTLYRNPSDGLASITYDAVTSVTVAVIRASS